MSLNPASKTSPGTDFFSLRSVTTSRDATASLRQMMASGTAVPEKRRRIAATFVAAAVTVVNSSFPEKTLSTPINRFWTLWFEFSFRRKATRRAPA